MRLLAIVLLLANVAWLGWDLNTRLQQRPARPSSAAATAAPTLTLLGELAELPPARSDAEPEAAGELVAGDAESVAHAAVDILPVSVADSVAPADGDGCIRLGPLSRADDLASLDAWLRGRGVSFWRLERGLGERRLLWVYLEPTASESEARERLAGLAAAGLEDYMLIRRGGMKNAISLGLFSSQESVNRRLAELGDKGYQPVVVPRYQAERRYWFDVAEFAWSGAGLEEVDLPLAVPRRPALCGQIEVDTASQ
jgi:hypothetical protein